MPNAHAQEGYEIMAPAGGLDAVAAALAGGADSVYFGAGALNMRSRSASSITLDDLPEIVLRCRDAGAKAYLALNSIVYQQELDLMDRMLERAAETGVSAVIASDSAVIERARSLGLPVHLSTQLSISNFRALRFYAQFADVVVLARELSLDDIADIAEAVKREDVRGPSGKPLRIECFCHGALCMAVSGRCNLSYFLRGKSGNRGECQHVCRRKYRLEDVEKGDVIDFDGARFLSPKDLKTIGIMDKMVAAGIKVFKIEGRARSPEYVRTTVECYREALDAVLEGRWAEADRADWDVRLGRVFNRGFWEGWYMGAESIERTMADGSHATDKKVYVGRCINYYPKAGVACFRIETQTIEEGDRFVVIGPTSGAVPGRVEGMLLEEVPITSAGKGDEPTFVVSERVRTGDRLYKLVPTSRFCD